jgi:hypothetical protein
MNWKEIWEEFDERYLEEVDEAFQQDMQAKYGHDDSAHVYMSPGEDWEYQKKLIQKIVEEKLHEPRT